MNNRLRDIPRSRVFTPGFKLFSGLAAFALGGGMLIGVGACKPDFVGWEYPPVVCSGDQVGLVDAVLGPITAGYKGGVGSHAAYGVFLGLALVGAFLAGVMTAFRDADPRSVAEVARTEAPPVAEPPRHLSYWPILGAFAMAVMVAGLVGNSATFVGGAVATGVVVLMWAMRNLAERATADVAANEVAHEQLTFGLEVPLIALVIIATTVMSLSRVLLAVSRTEAVVVAGVVAAVVFGAGIVIANVRRISTDVVVLAVVLFGVAVVGAGLLSATGGERDFEHEVEHDVEQIDDSGAGDHGAGVEVDTGHAGEGGE